MATLEQHVDALAADVPKLDAALKNLLSFALAEAKATGESQRQMQDVTRGVQAAARALSLAFNALQLPAAPQWGLQHPQGEEETAVHRMESLTAYKAAHAMCEKVHATAGTKVTHMFGKLFLDATLAWSDIKNDAENRIPESGSASDVVKGAYMQFLQDFEAGLAYAGEVGGGSDGVEQIQRADATGDWDEEVRSARGLAEIIWSTDLGAVLQARSERRAARVEARNRREAANQNGPFSHAMRDAAAVLEETQG
mmetsp:Transcript_37656/g.106404  ORF Transcript_37656/g.106404 Transcript_37656/m.106404 type:complete len:254 (-) Transcript_37656:173-934(-)|eukprot:CAMPEP_0117674344 /NCGR_PEP_ID=MMETSP0804-20121206/14985_1 /TAXON_ID=1074897 /ORGANISM="Tetraselmis astigmatica, Strain CCMP880" /LENGTH=253 /DNA_ID=CAMNT_0005483201 /DNA_START=70 /DNA_END=831 /DNA_ORIENTATION=+